MPDLIGAPLVEVYTCSGGYLVVATVPLEPGSDEETNRRYVCFNTSEVLAKVTYAIEASDAVDSTQINKAMKEKGPSASDQENEGS